MVKKKSNSVGLPRPPAKAKGTEKAKTKTKVKKDSESKRRSKNQKSEEIVLTKVKKTSSPPISSSTPRGKSPGRTVSKKSNSSSSNSSTTPTSLAKQETPKSSKSNSLKVIKEKRIRKSKTISNSTDQAALTSRQPRKGRPPGAVNRNRIQNSQTHVEELPAIDEEPMDMVDGNQNHRDEQEETPTKSSGGWFRSCSLM